MIGKITIGKSFRGCIAYCLNDKIEKHEQEKIIKDRAEVLLFNKCFGNERELVQQFNEVRQFNPRLSKPVLHITLSLALGEILSKDKLMQMSEDCAKELGFENDQFISISHRDTDHQHVHIVANRIGFDKRTVSDSNNYQKIAKFCRKMEMKYELKQVLSPKKFLSKEQRNIPRFDKRKELLKQHIKDALKQCSSFSQFEQRMKEKGNEIIKGRGISFADEKKVKVKGSELDYSLQTIEKILEKQRIILSPQIKKDGHGNRTVFKKEPSKVDTISHSIDKKEDSTKLLEQLMKPEKLHEEIDKHLLQKKPKKKRQHL